MLLFCDESMDIMLLFCDESMDIMLLFCDESMDIRSFHNENKSIKQPRMM